MDANHLLNCGNYESEDLHFGLSFIDSPAEILDGVRSFPGSSSMSPDEYRLNLEALNRGRQEMAAAARVRDTVPIAEESVCFSENEIVGRSSALNTALSHAMKVAATDCTVLITGETGTGKDLVARAIHRRSARSKRSFVAINCAAIPASLVASELFGHEKGAFTGALQQRQGRFELAQGGTIFLDEVGELPAETQITLLRVLQERQFERVGGSRLLNTDVRIIAATNRDLAAAISEGSFRSDLFYRLNVFPIRVPPLRDRKEDIPLLINYFAKHFASKMGKAIRRIDQRALNLSKAYHWPGNIRELQNIIERSVILSESETLTIDEASLPSEPPSRFNRCGHLREALLIRETKIIEDALVASKGRIAGENGAAAKLGIPPSTLDSKIKQFRIKKEELKLRTHASGV